MLKRLTCLSALAALVPLSVAALWPLPRNFTSGNAPLLLASNFSINASFEKPADFRDACDRTMLYLHNDKLQPLNVDRGASLAGNMSSSPQLTSLQLYLTDASNVTTISEEVVKPPKERDESYSLNIPAEGGEAKLTANTTLGLFRGLTTFGQLWYTVDNTTFAIGAPWQITDSPAFPYRGFMLDTARNYFPVDDINRLLDTMSWVKLNQFHWHIVDSQSFPLKLPNFPEIAKAGAYSNDSIYTAGDVSKVVAFAASRGIDVLVEVDTPGHTSAISASHPEHVACAGKTPWATYANEPPAGQLRIASDDTANFTASLLADVANLFPSSLFSTGGDEINANCYQNDEETQQSLSSSGKTIEQALDGFTNVTHKAVRDAGKTPVVWEEMVLQHNVTLENDTVVMVWISSDDVKAVAEKGFQIVHAASDYFYLDCGAGGWVGANPAGNSWCDPFKTWQKSYSFDPYGNLTSDQYPLVLGGESLLWTEQSSPENMDSIIWPRAASAAEVFWTGDQLPGGVNRTSLQGVQSALPRLHDWSFRTRARGTKTISLQPLWCALRPGVCDLTA
ncbi:N-acetylhexosaminidase [Fomitiporia mediterranea MF3/22]|uniref:N-acetylhexosaminidase n=1 Tax=Fomitiporia mediterranea (strain MF3/22) TaxID=694068 RepID=UPI00044097E4|nr:N-acetylhexosaminidase [Fomitiporia mediterranea MF3/22]EJC98414.1 N-acetylhexosaminidase [Fomitiporia mediterranea MF3/22]